MREPSLRVHEKSAPLDLEELRRRLREARGPRYWRSLEELAGRPEFQELLHREFPQFAAEWGEGLSRRRFLQLAGASLALAGLTACTRQPLEKIVPYVRQPEEIVPGRPLYFATAMPLAGYGVGLLVESHTGRPTKVEGNPDHPASRGATDLFAQASILELYDPDRSQVLTHLGRIRTWTDFVAELQGTLNALAALKGEGLRILTGTITSPSLAQELGNLFTRLPEARWHLFEAAGRDSVRLGGREAFGEWIETRYDLARAQVILALESDFLTQGPGCLRYARDFMAGRRLREGEETMNRLYAVESTPTGTGAVADHRLALRPQEISLFALALAAELGVPGAERPEGLLPPPARSWVQALARDLAARRGQGLVVAGDWAPPEVHVLAHAMNAFLGNRGETVIYTDPVEARPVHQLASLRELVEDMAAGRVDTLLILGGNPVYDTPADLDFARALQNVRLRIHLGLYADETAEHCHWHLPEAHYLESWGDARAYDGTASVVQPLIEPLYGGKTAPEVLAAFNNQPTAKAYDLVRQSWRSQGLGEDFEAAWRRALHDGWIQGSAFPSKEVTLREDAVSEASGRILAAHGSEGLDLVFRPDPGVYDGRFANNGWLQECPRPLTKLTWDNALLLSPATAEAYGLESQEVVEVRVQGRTQEVPVWILPGQAEGCATLHLGYGRRRAGRVGTGTGFDAYPLRTSETQWVARGVKLRTARRRHPLASTQDHHLLAHQILESREARARHLLRSGTLEEFRHHPEFVHEMGHSPPSEMSLYPGYRYEGYAWGLAVDLSACTGCNACVVACQAENNIPVVGKEQVLLGREMHWLRIDRYFEGEVDDPVFHHQPVMCMHCEQAPCEVVCPVAATVHSDEGLNDMVYNRCVGTRYCSNNCPYKVRRFNFLHYSKTDSEVVKLGRNPDVTVRTRGVMEKCTYCVQRINSARIEAKKENRKIRDGEIQTACQQACPTQAIVFGDVNDPDSAVSRWKAHPLNYGLLEDLNTRPRTTYLARIRNPNPELEGG